jgi:hypothetical protein
MLSLSLRHDSRSFVVCNGVIAFIAVEQPAGAMKIISTPRKIRNISKLCASDPNRINRLAMDFVL